MIKASELRIGNKFTMSGGTMVNTVFEIVDNTNRGKIEFVSPEHKLMYSHLILVEENGNQYKPFEIEGTPLTGEWLLKFGFEKFFYDEGELTEGFYLTKEFPLIGFITTSSTHEYLFDDETDTLRLKYVHQLQNLYFAITGKELVASI